MDSTRIYRAISIVVTSVVLLILAGLCSSLAEAASSVVATKTKNPDGTYNTTTASFSISTDQLIKWTANYFDSPPAGDGYYLHRPSQPLNELPLSTSLSSGLNTGTYFLTAGNYEISINYFGMGAGNYSIEYNLTASIGVSPTTHDFGNLLTGAESSPQTFTISSSGDLPVTINTVASSDATHFPVSSAPTGQNVPPSRTFQVKFQAGSAAGSFNSDITVSGTSSLGTVASPPISVYGTTVEPTASINVFPTAYDFGSLLTGDVSSTQPFTISSTGDVPVTITSIFSSDATHFPVSSAPTGQNVPPSRTFYVKFLAGSAPGPYESNITVSGTSSLGPVNFGPVSVSGITLPRIADISCNGSSCSSNPNLGSADWFTGEVKTFPYSFQNVGTADLVLTSIAMINDSPGSPFSPASTPSTAPLPPGGSRTVSIRFAPPSTGEGVYCGHLEIISEDPDEPVKLCYFAATAHHPAPIMRLESTTIDYIQVELGFAFTKTLTIFNDGDAPLEATVSENTPSPLAPNLAHWPEVTTSWSVSSTVNVGSDPWIIMLTYQPQATGLHSIQLQVSGNENPDVDVILTGEGIPPIPIDAVLVLDRSGSMADPAGSRYKIDALRDAASMFTNLLRVSIPNSSYGDGIGFVRYNNVNDVYLPLDLVSNSTHLSDANTKLNDNALQDVTNGLKPFNATGIGGAMQTAADMFSVPGIGRKHVMVVLTDGIENRDPRIADVHDAIIQGDPDLHIYSVGLGDQHESAKLMAITNVTNGYHQVSGALEGTAFFDLELFYFKIFANATDLQIVVDPTVPVNIYGTTPRIVASASVTSSDRSAVFLVLDEENLRDYYDLELIDPQGQVIQLGASVGGVPVHQFRQYNYTIYRIVFPDPAQSMIYVGNWDLRLTPNGKFDSTDVKAHIASLHNTVHAYTNVYQGIIPVGFAAAVGSDYRMKVDAVPSHLQPGAAIEMVAILTDRGSPVDDATVTVNITTPSGTQYQNVALVLGGEGNWAKNFTHTGEVGSYRFWFRSIGKNFRGETVRREDTRFVTLTYPKPEDEPEKRCIPCWLQYLLWILVIVLLLLILIWCCRRRHLLSK